MANAEQLRWLQKGSAAWNKWRERTDYVEIDLREAQLNRAQLRGADLGVARLSGAQLWEADLGGANLNGAQLCKADLHGTHLSGAGLIGAHLSDANLHGARLSGAYLWQADLRSANLHDADLQGAQLWEADLRDADLTGAHLWEADLNQANLNGACLNGADLGRARLSRAQLRGTDLRNAGLSEVDLNSADFTGSNLSGAIVGSIIFGNLDLSEVTGLEKVIHRGPSNISIDTLTLSKGNIPEIFLKGCGLSDADIEYSKLSNPALSNEEINKILYKMYDLRATQALQIYPLFISYNRTDSEFVDKVGNSLTKKGIRYWRDLHDMKAGRIEKQIDRAIRQNPTVLLVLSEGALSSDWVEHEVRTARALEKDTGRDVLCPIALDDSWKSSPWPKRLMEQIMEYNILDFSAWKDDVKFDGMFHKLIDGLELFYKDKSHGE